MKMEDNHSMYYFWMQVKHSIVFAIVNYLIYCKTKSMSPNCTIVMLYVSQSGVLCKVEQQKFN